MAVTVRPTKADVNIARAIARRTSRAPEEVSQGVTWGADEHVLLGLAVGWWIWARIYLHSSNVPPNMFSWHWQPLRLLRMF
jgi:hypothetical protein